MVERQEGWVKRNIITIVGWAFMLGAQAGTLTLLDRRVTKLEDLMREHHEDKAGLHVTKEWRDDMRQSIRDLSAKLDTHEQNTMGMLKKMK